MNKAFRRWGKNGKRWLNASLSERESERERWRGREPDREVLDEELVDTHDLETECIDYFEEDIDSP